LSIYNNFNFLERNYTSLSSILHKTKAERRCGDRAYFRIEYAKVKYDMYDEVY
jgi:hypothetical protein